ncbi:type III effector 1 [Pseudomonas sp. Z1-6]|uniref:type III effector 1 n=1 Tax=Pseudomonas sp. Z1-6 TaxID=2817407 RepID=UPI003DA954F5
MDDATERQASLDDAVPVISSSADTATAILEKLTRWHGIIDARMQTQMTFLALLEEYLLVELRTHYYQGNIDPHFVGTLLDAVLRQIIDQAPAVFDEQQDAPYRWSEGADLGFSAERRDIISQALEGTVSGFIRHYKDYLRRHWKMAEEDASLDEFVRQRLDEHMASIDEVFHPDKVVGLDVDELREKIQTLQDAWHEATQLQRLATPQEREAIDAVARLHLPEWLRVLSEFDRKTLLTFQEQTAQTQARLDELLDGLGSLRAFAKHLAKDYVRHELDMDVEPERVQVQLQWRTVVGQPVRTYSLSELLAAGPMRPDAISVLLVENGDMLRNQPLSPTFIAQLLANVDAPAGYLPALTSRYDKADLKDAMFDRFLARLQHSAFIARCAGQLTDVGHDRLMAQWEREAAARAKAGLHVAGLVLPNGLKCTDLLLFYREDPRGEPDDLLLYAPGKPDGQEWIELISLRALSAEIGGWTASDAGCFYLLQQLAPGDRAQARQYLSRITATSVTWDLNKDLRGTVAGFEECIRIAVSMGLTNELAEVELNESPRWYSALPVDSRRHISGLNQEVLIHQQMFNDLLAEYEVFVDFAKRTVMQAIAPYLRSKGVQEPVDPATVLIDYRSGWTGGKHVASLLDLVIHGYDDNWGIDDPQKGVLSSVGQDLTQLRSADLALYIRRAHLGEHYAKYIRGKFLNPDAPQYLKRRDAYRYLQLARIDRDLRVAYGQSILSSDEFRWLTRQVTLLGQWDDGAPPMSSTSAVAQEGMIKFTVGGHVVLGVYVFIYFDPKASYWLYTPDSPDGIAFRRYLDFSGSIAAQLHDYVMARVGQAARAAVRRTLESLAIATTRVDTLREFNRVSNIAAQFDAYIERSVSDVQDITTSRVEMIKNQVVKGLLMAALPVCMIYPPFILFLDVTFIVIGSRQAIEAHRQNDLDAALGRWLEVSWGTLFAMFGPPSVYAPLIWAFRKARGVLRSISAQGLGRLASAAVNETGPVTQPIRFKPRQAASQVPKDLQEVTEEGVFQGTYCRPPSASHPQSTYYIRSNGKYYQVRRDPYFDGLCLVDASRPGALYKLPIRRLANGKWAHNAVGLKGGNDGVRNLGRVGDLREAFPGHVFPDVTRGAMQGEAVVARFSEAITDHYLFSLNAQTCVVASMYNPITKIGAVIHFDHNIRKLIERGTKAVMSRLGGPAKDVRVTLVGGDWLTGADIGEPVRQVMRRQGLQPTWDYWSYSSCFGNTYGVSLDLRSGLTTVFKTSQGQVERFYVPVLARAKKGSDPVSMRARTFMTRYRSEPLVANANGAVRTREGRPATAAQLALNEFTMVVLG